MGQRLREDRQARQRVYRIGADQSPPYSMLSPNRIEGMNIDILNEAARRAGIRLEWVPTPFAADDAFARRVVDLWPAGGATPWRTSHLYVSDPWLYNDFVLVSLASSPVLQAADLRPGRQVAYRGGGLAQMILEGLFPAGSLRNYPTREDALAALCRGDAAAAVAESRSLQRMLIDRPEPCVQARFQVKVLTDYPYRLSLLAEPDSAVAARLIRSALDGMIRDGSLLEMEARWAPIATGGDRRIFALGEAERTTSRMLWVTAALFGLTCVLCALVWAAFHARARAQSAEQEAREGHSLLRALGDNLPNGAVYQVIRGPGEDWRFSYLSSGIQQQTGVSPDEAMRDASALFSLVLEEDRARFLREQEESFRNLTVFDTEVRLRRRDGEIRRIHLSSTPRRLPDGRVRWDGIQTDITARKTAEAALAEEVARRNVLFEQSSDGIALLDTGGKLVECNPAFAQMLGYPVADLANLHVWDWDAAWSQSELVQRLEERSGAVTFETRHRRADGTVFDVEVSSAPVVLGGVKYLYAIHRDVTARKAAEAAVRESRRLEAIGILAGGMAHEFNNLLTVINGYATLLSRRFESDTRALQGISAIRGAGERAASLTRQLLAFGQRQSIRPRMLEWNAVVQESRPAWAPLLREDIVLKIDLGPSGLVSVDPEQMRDALLELVKNAVDALPDGGEIAIATALAEISPAEALRRPGGRPGRFAVLSVADNGVGMDQQTREHIFEPFFTTKDRATTTGLGLATVHGVVAQHGGWIAVDSAPGKGSTFRVYLPCAVADGGGEAPADGPPRGGQETILVVEDEEAVRRLAVTVLAEEGYRILEAASGSEATAVVERCGEEIGLVITDVVMPGTSAQQLADDLKARRPALKVLFVSGYPDSVVARHHIAVGKVPFLQKPYSPDLLVSTVRDLLAKV